MVTTNPETDRNISVLFVCLGNTCRSTMAEGILRHLISREGQSDQWTVDSAAIADWQVGRLIDKRTRAVFKKHNIAEFSHTARQITRNDFFNFKHILGMDNYNIKDLKRIKPEESAAVIELLGQYDTENNGNPQIPDPFISSQQEFETIYKKCRRSCEAFFASQSRNINDSS